MFERFRQGNQQAVELVEKSAKAIANLIADLKISLDIQKVVLGVVLAWRKGICRWFNTISPSFPLFITVH